MSKTRNLKTEYAIVGSGPGGAVTAAELARDGKDVIILEEGRSLRPQDGNSYGLNDMLHKYRNAGITFSMGNPKVNYVEGCVVGGGSEVNCGLYYRTPEEVFERWSKEFDVKGLEPETMRPVFESIEKRLGIGFDPSGPTRATAKLKDGADRLGWKTVEVPRWFEYASGPERRRSMSQTFIPDAIESGARLFAETRVTKFSRSGSYWEIHAERGGEAVVVTAEHLVLAAGSIHTPTLLLKNGIRRNVGRNLRMHPTVRAIARFPEALNSDRLDVPYIQVKEFSPSFTLGGSVSSKSYLAASFLEDPGNLRRNIEDWRHFAIYHAAVSSEARGRVLAVPGFRDPFVSFQVTSEDAKNLNRGLESLSRLLFEAGASEVHPGVSGMRPIRSLEPLRSGIHPKMMNLMTIHLLSSCPMGENKNDCAVDSFGRVFGQKNLYVSDASVLCTATSVNPQGTIMAIAARNAKAWLGTL